MPHLSPEELVNLAERGAGAVRPAHLAECEHCQRQLADLHQALEAASSFDVPEPSPLFWDHLSARVRVAIASEPEPARRTFLNFWSLRPVSAAAVGVIVIALAAVLATRRTPGTPPAPLPAVEGPAAAGPSSIADPTLRLVSDLGGTLDWDEVREQFASSPHAGGLDVAVGELNPDERRELERLLKEELARPPAGPDRS
jgi:hypothetical protein